MRFPSICDQTSCRRGSPAGLRYRGGEVIPRFINGLSVISNISKNGPYGLISKSFL